MKPFEKRVQEERDALAKKLNALSQFLQGARAIEVSPRDIDLLREQETVMKRYVAILELRLSNFKSGKS